jgi:Ser/Thr protein kinase RdoA (MazF antagonist)
MSFDIKFCDIYHRWGSALGGLHAASQGFRTENFQFTSWEESFEELETYIFKEEDFVKKEIFEVFSLLKNIKKSKYNFGLTHGDHRKGNVFTDLKEVSIIDFDLPRYCFFVDDLARPFVSSIAHKSIKWQDKVLPYIQGYASKRRLNHEDVLQIPHFVRFKALELYLWTKNNWNSETAPGGGNIKGWVEMFRRIIIDRSWMENLNKTLENISIRLNLH